ncbi:MAG: hypothetical protein RLY43_2458 [Bacteroidota bacterium]
MRKVLIVDNTNTAKEGYILEESDLKEESTDKKKNITQHLYMGYLIVGTLVFTFTLFHAIKKLKK